MMGIVKTEYISGLVCELCGNIITADFKMPTENEGEEIPEEMPCPECGIVTMKFERLPVHTYEED